MRQSPDVQLNAGVTLANRYLIQETIGIGGMGAVYRARDLHFPNVVKLVAVKEMINQAGDPSLRNTIVKNFEREADLLATLSHPAIPRIFDYFTQQDRSYLILEFVQGKNLDEILTENPDLLCEAQIVSWGIELCDVLEYLHNHQPERIIFRDMKPSNVMINQYNHIVLVDFGIAKTFQVGQKGTMIGTEGYSPPEQYRGEATTLVDIYALGATMHHLLTRRDPRLEPPFSFAERPIRQINPEVSLELENVIATALQYNPTDRYQSAGDMKSALLEISATLLTTTTTYTALTKGPESNQVRPLWVFTCNDEVRGGATYDSGVVYVGSYDQYLYALSAKSGKLLWKYTTDGGIVSRPAVQGDNVCFGSKDHRLHMISARSGTVQWTYYTKGAVHSSPTIALGHIFVGSDDGSLHAIGLTSGRSVWQADSGAPIRSTPAISNETILFGNEIGELSCLDFRGVARWRFKAKRAITASPVICDDLVLFTSLDSHLYALDAKSGWLVWRLRLGKGSISSPFVNNGFVYTGCIDGNIYCVEIKSAKEAWRFQTDHQVNGSPIVYQQAVYFGSVDGHVYCLDMQTGALLWKFSTGSPVTATPAAHDDVIYIGANNHAFYAFPARN